VARDAMRCSDICGRLLSVSKESPRTRRNANPLKPFPIAGALWEVMSWDLIGPLPESCTFNTIVTMVDMQTKAIKLKPANITILAMGAAVVMRDGVYREERLSVKIISDCSPQFISCFIEEFYKLLGIEGT
jgi:hypothetical protein